MKICSQCHAEQPDDAAVCGQCGAELTGEPVPETPEETAAEAVEETAGEVTGEVSEKVTEEIFEETPEEVSEEAPEEAPGEPAEPEKKKIPWGWIAGLAAAVVLVVVLILVKGNAGSKAQALTSALHTNAYGNQSYSIHYEQNEEGETTFTQMNEEGKLLTVKADAVAGIMDQTVATCGATELTNRELQYYYDQQYYYFYSTYGSYMGFFMDTSLPLDEQLDLNGSDTWQAYFLDGAVQMYHQVAALYQAATEKGFTLTQDQQAELDSALDLESQAAKYGFADVEEFMRGNFGPFATAESYREFLRMNLTASYYAMELADAIELSDSDVEAYYDENADTIAGNYGVEKVDKPVISVRHILIQPETTTDAEGAQTITDEAWAAAEAQAQEIYEAWLAGEATEDSFAAMANEKSSDPGSNTNGGLYDEVYPGQMVPEFNDWCFADGRQVGDHGVVKTSYGYHIMFFSGEGDYVYWRMVAEDLLRGDCAAAERSQLVSGYPMESDLTKAAILDMTAPTVPAEEPAADEPAADESAAG